MKFAVSVIAPFIITVAGFDVPVKEPVPVPVHEVKLCPRLGFALIVTVEPALYQPEAGDTVPSLEGLATIVKKN